MAEKRKNNTNGKGKATAGTKSVVKTGKKNNSKNSGTLNKESKREKKTVGKSFSENYAPYMIGVATLFVAICIYAGDSAGIVGGAIRNFLLGMNGTAAFGLPALMVVHLIRYRRDRVHNTVGWCYFATLSIYVSVSVLLQVSTGCEKNITAVGSHWKLGNEDKGGGIIGGIVGEAMLKWFGKPCTLLLTIAFLIVCLLFLFNVTPKSICMHLKDGINRRRAEALKTDSDDYDEYDGYYEREENADSSVTDTYRIIPKNDTTRVRRKKFCPDVPIDDDGLISAEEPTENSESQEDRDKRIFDEVMSRTQARMARERGEVPQIGVADNTATTPTEKTEILSSVYGEDDSSSIDLTKIFVNPDEAGKYAGDSAGKISSDTLETVREELNGKDNTSSEITDTAQEQEKSDGEKEYVFPPISLLTAAPENKDDNIMDEIKSNAVKLVEILNSFNVRVKIENVSRGPTITRYELLPEAGVRVKSIINLLDDISLALATTGVRIEAPIPGKAAVGIEVPNKKRATVHLRTLLEADEFLYAKSKTLCALGEDVGGTPVYLDVAKMPHLLVAGATGMGKSVCINSLIVSLLYNAKPDEVKLILIDPKKVEFGIYNGIPHLLVPVVTNPKKAAGSLSWAVSEMERRFGLIEEVGVRDVGMFNKVTASDSAYEFLPNIIIIIDELADLMMTAPDDVEDSICRLMQKARAAGMYVIIGTQRPSVDVITGLIKANIPSRIACKVASQVDSRTIIDRAGAENLIGRGDMLYSPVGAPKPVRVQGSFVSEEDVEKIVSFIKNENKKGAEYSEEVIAKIDEEASRCGSGSKKTAMAVGDDDDGGDPMLRSALELAVNSGKISTSLIERRLSLGYGRAAKLIDKMEQLGYVSAPNGQKPREVLITKEQYMEMIMKKDNPDEGVNE